MPSRLARASSSCSSASRVGSGFGEPSSRKSAFLDRIADFSNVPPTPTPRMSGGQASGPAFFTHSITKSFTPGSPAAGVSIVYLERFSQPPPLAITMIFTVVPGATVKIMVMAKGGGCENRSRYTMLTPAAGLPGVKDFVIECVKNAGPDACPPLILGVGVGGTFEKSAILSKKALFRELGSPNPDPTLDALEQELLARANRLGIGPQGYGGDTTSFGIHILTYPCHITSLPVAVTIECHAHRHKEVTL